MKLINFVSKIKKMIAILILTFTIITLSAKFLLSIINKQKEINKVKLKDTWTKIIDQTLNNPNINAKQNERLKIDNFNDTFFQELIDIFYQKVCIYSFYFFIYKILFN